jgi:transcriptional regulator GlxA family with amidase domain
MSVRSDHLPLVRVSTAPQPAPAALPDPPARRSSAVETGEGDQCLRWESESAPCALSLPLRAGADYRVRRALKLMNEDPRHSAREVAQRLKLSLSRLRQLFRAGIGVPPCHYLKHLRLHRAKRLAETTTMPIAEVISTVGETDESHFRRCFKQHFGCTLDECRAAAREAACEESWEEAPPPEAK